MKYYIVTAKCGHVGRGSYIPIDFPVKADSKKTAAKIVRYFPRVKHHHKDAILSCQEVTEKIYYEVEKKNRKDMYLFCHSRKEQKLYCNLEDRLIRETNCKIRLVDCKRQDRVAFILKKHKIMDKEYLRQCQYFINKCKSNC